MTAATGWLHARERPRCARVAVTEWLQELRRGALLAVALWLQELPASARSAVAVWLHELPTSAQSALAVWLHELHVRERVRAMRRATRWLISIVLALTAATERLHVRRRARWARHQVGRASPWLIAIVLVVGFAFLVENMSG
jgi:hypothetical protein